jgi:hypothetical protein
LQLRTVRGRTHSAEDLAAAEAAYRAALGELVALEQGERPTWAPVLGEAAIENISEEEITPAGL